MLPGVLVKLLRKYKGPVSEFREIKDEEDDYEMSIVKK